MNENKVSNKHILAIAIPLFLGRAAEVLAASADTIFLGRYEGGGLEAIGYSLVFLSVCINFAFGFSKGTQIMIAQSLGDEKQTNKLFKNSLVIMLGMSLSIMCLMFLITPWLISSITSSTIVATLSIDYLMVRYWGIPIIFINTLFVAYFSSKKNTSVILKGTILLIILNFFFNYVFVFGKFGAPSLGIQGAALATLIAEIALFLFYVFRLPSIQLITRFKNYIDWTQIKKVVSLSIPLGSRNLVSIAGFFAFFWLIESMEGERADEISSVIINIFSFFLIPTTGFQAATNILIGEQYAAKNYGYIRSLSNRISLLCTASVAVIVFFSFLFPELILSAFVDENKSYIIPEAIPIVYIIGFACLFIAWEKVIIDTISGMGKTDVSLYIEIVATLTYVGLAFVFIKYLNLSIAWAWSLETVYALVLGGLSYLFVYWFVGKKVAQS